MYKHDASEQAYKNGYSAGYEAGRRSVGEQKWIPVTERLPEKDGKYLVFEKGVYGTDTATLRFAKDGRKVDKYDFLRGWKNVWYRYDSEWGHITIDNVTHWMPVPEPPNCGADMRGEEDGR